MRAGTSSIYIVYSRYISMHRLDVQFQISYNLNLPRSMYELVYIMVAPFSIFSCIDFWCPLMFPRFPGGQHRIQVGQTDGTLPRNEQLQQHFRCLSRPVASNTPGDRPACAPSILQLPPSHPVSVVPHAAAADETASACRETAERADEA